MNKLLILVTVLALPMLVSLASMVFAMDYCFVGQLASPFDCNSVYCQSNGCAKLVGDYLELELGGVCQCRFNKDVDCATLHTKARCVQFKKFCGWRIKTKTCFRKASSSPTMAPTSPPTQPTQAPTALVVTRCPRIPSKGCAATYHTKPKCNANPCCTWNVKKKKCRVK